MEDQWVRCPACRRPRRGSWWLPNLGESATPPSYRDPLPLNLREFIIHPDKTRLVDFRPKRTEGARHPEADGTSFDFLGLTHVWRRSRNGKDMVRQVTAKSRFARAVAAVSGWCRKNRHWSLRDQHRHLSSMMRGHFAYYGVGGNSRRLRWFANQVARVWRKWLSRRDRQGVVRWARFN